MKKVALLLVVLLLFTSCGTNSVSTPSEPLTISVAASLKNVMNELKSMYNEEISFNFGSSGDLQTQIQQGAPADVFISAATKQMNELEKGGFLLDGTKRDFLENKLVLIAPKGKENSIKGFADVASDSIKQVAIGEISSVPAGQYAQEVFNNLGIWDKVKGKAVFGKDVTQVLTYVEQGEVEAGVVYMTDAKSSQKVDIIEASNKTIIYPIAIIKESKNIEGAKKFIEFLSSDEAKAVFVKYGFDVK